MEKRVIIIGGGAAGMLAAVAASERQAQVHIYEKNEKLGKKLYITGKGRCNITNACEDTQTLLENVVSNSKFLYSAFYSFGNHDIIRLLEKNGLRVKTERGLRVFPESDKSSDVIKTLSNILERNQVHIHLNNRVKKINIDNGNVNGIILEDGTQEPADSVIVATGGLSYQSTGSTGDGYEFAKRAGHSVTDLSPSLVPLTVSEEWCTSLQGLSLKNISFSMYNGEKKVFEEFGEMMFTHFGVTGPVILKASSCYSRIKKKKKVTAYIDLKPALSEKQLDSRILRDFGKSENRQIINALGHLMPHSIIPAVLMLSGLDPHMFVRDVTRSQRQQLVRIIKHLPLTITGTRGFTEAVITHGGVNVREIRPDTMESKKIHGLFFAGEVLDLDGYTGGFNLQIAWSTGYAAGKAAADG